MTYISSGTSPYPPAQYLIHFKLVTSSQSSSGLTVLVVLDPLQIRDLVTETAWNSFTEYNCYRMNPHLVEDAAAGALLDKHRHIKQVVACEELRPLDPSV